ncbi:hypothetical protein QF042_001224 [Pedobacter sp. W3I1]|uniref:hypothetical protein n=1 Tax=Pedobacter sp. W3I1 TaxID=3042291 RepID=UPI00278550C4|nr:hypothetical protein [Pedobacter sp. W3I1]MDQ0637659.1 hypothetical protein [Pedobacter sp. W3I1]
MQFLLSTLYNKKDSRYNSLFNKGLCNKARENRERIYLMNGLPCSIEVPSPGRSGIPEAQRKDIAENGNTL